MPQSRGSDGRFVSGNGVSIGIGVDDHATAPIKAIANNIKASMIGIQGSISMSTAGIASSVTNNISRMVTGLAMATAVIGAGAIAFGDFSTGFSKAAEMQTAQITSSFTLATMIGSTVTDAKKAVKELNTEMVKLGDTLPGATENYQKFAQTLTPTIALMSKGDMGKYKSTIMEASKYGGLMTAIGGGDGNENAMTLNRYVSGTLSQGEAHRHELFAKNPTYATFEKQAMKQMGLTGKDWEKQLTTAQRVAVFNLANSLMFTPAMLAAYGMTADTQFQALKSKLFNPTVGIFGFMREIKGLDGRSSLDAIMTFMGQATTMGDEAGKWLSSHGINLDPMEAIGHMMDTASGWASAITALLGGDGSGMKTMLSALGIDVMKAPKALVDGLNNMLVGTIANLKKTDPKKVGSNIAEFFNGLGAALSSIRIQDIVQMLNYARSALDSAIQGIDWAKFGDGLADGLAKALAMFDWKKAGDTLDRAYYAAINALAHFIGTSFNHLNRSLSKAAGYTDNKSTPGQVGAMNKGDKIKHQFFDNLFGRDRLDPEKTKGAQDIPGTPMSSLPSIGQMSNTGGSSSFNPTINITGMAGDSAKQIADYVMVAFNDKYMQYRDAALV